MKLRPVISDAALTTASMSALTKLSVTVSSAADETRASANSAPAASLAAPRRQLRNEILGSGSGAGPAGGAAIGSGGGPFLGRRRERMIADDDSMGFCRAGATPLGPARRAAGRGRQAGGRAESKTPPQCIQSRKPALERRKNEPPPAAARPPLRPGRGHSGRPCRRLRTLRSHGRGRREPVGAAVGRADGRPGGRRQGCQGHGRTTRSAAKDAAKLADDGMPPRPKPTQTAKDAAQAAKDAADAEDAPTVTIDRHGIRVEDSDTGSKKRKRVVVGLGGPDREYDSFEQFVHEDRGLAAHGGRDRVHRVPHPGADHRPPHLVQAAQEPDAERDDDPAGRKGRRPDHRDAAGAPVRPHGQPPPTPWPRAPA